MPQTIQRKKVRKFIENLKGEFFSVQFIKKDNSLRDMNCRTGVSKYVKGVGLAYDPKDYGLVTVFDAQKMSYRMISLKTLISIRAEGQLYLAID